LKLNRFIFLLLLLSVLLVNVNLVFASLHIRTPPYANGDTQPYNICITTPWSQICAYIFPNTGKFKAYAWAAPSSVPGFPHDVYIEIKGNINANPAPGNSPIIDIGNTGLKNIHIDYTIRGYLKGTDPILSTARFIMIVKIWRFDFINNQLVVIDSWSFYDKSVNYGTLQLSGGLYKSGYFFEDGYSYAITIHFKAIAAASCYGYSCNTAKIELYHAVRPHVERGVWINYYGYEDL